MTPSARAHVAPGPAVDAAALHCHHGTPRGGPTARARPGTTQMPQLVRGGAVQPVPRATEAQAAPPPRAVTQYHTGPTHRPSWGEQVAAAGGVTGPSRERTAEPWPGLLLDRPLSAPALPGAGLVIPAPTCCVQSISRVQFSPSLSCCLIHVSFGGHCHIRSGGLYKMSALGAADCPQQQFNRIAHTCPWPPVLFGGLPRPPGGQVGWRHVGQGRGCFSG